MKIRKVALILTVIYLFFVFWGLSMVENNISLGSKIFIYSTSIYIVSFYLYLMIFNYSKSRGKKVAYNNDKNDESINELYNYLNSTHGEQLEEKRKRLIKKITIAGIGYTFLLVLLIFVGINIPEISPIYMIPIVILCCICAVFTKNITDVKKEYVEEYKYSIIAKFISLLNPQLVFDINVREGIKQEYYNSEFDKNKFNRFSMEDYVKGNISENTFVEISEINTKLRTSNGRNSHVTEVFCGMFTVIPLDFNLTNIIKICKNKTFKNNIQLDDTEFEKYFDVTAIDNNLAVRILTADVMKLMIDFYQKTGIIYEINIKENRIYLRFSTGKMFEPKIWGNCIDRKQIYTYYYTFKFIIEVSEKINNILKELES